MSAEYRELLSFTSIDHAVDQLFRAYLDTKLIGFADQLKDDAEYHERVLAYRSESLDPYSSVDELPPGIEPGSNEAREARATKLRAASSKYRGSRAQFDAAQAYLYWFDIRARYWCDKRPAESLLKLVEPKTEIVNLRQQATILQSRIARAHGATKSLAGPTADQRSAGTARDATEQARRSALLELIAHGADSD